jgi:hypothetical protein
MKTIIKSAALISAVSLLAACGGDEASDSSVSQNYHKITTTLQGSIFNAIDGSRITDESLKVTLVQGTDYRDAKVRKGTADFAGDYAINKIPTATGAGNINYRIVSSVDGFQSFEATIAFNVTTAGLQDSQANRIGNIYMYPLGSFASEVKVNVTFNNEPVANASVLLNPQTNANTPTTDTSNTLFAAQGGFQSAQTVVTDASGVATFSAASLVLGGQYSIDVLPVAHEGSQLALNTGTTTIVGTSNNINNIALAETVPGTQNGLYVTSASNLDTDKITSGGALTLTFSRAVSLVDETAMGATLTNATTAVLDATSVPNSNVAGVLSADGLTLTLTPQFSTAPVAHSGTNGGTADNGLLVNFTTVFVRINDASDSAVVYDVFALTAETGVALSASVQATANF